MKRIFIIILFSVVLPYGLFADVPVIDMSSDAISNGGDDRIKKLEDQVNYLKNSLARMDELQQEVQVLQGQLEEEQHTIQRFTALQKNNMQKVYAENSNVKNNYASETKLPDSKNVIDNNVSSSVVAENNIDNQTAVNTKTNLTEKNVTDLLKEQQTYQNAFKLVQTQQYNQAITALNNYLSNYPNGKYTARSHYWLGQLFMLNGETDKAVTEFNNIVNNYNNSAKAPDAMLILGSIEYTQSNWNNARKWWQQILKQYPSSSASKIASNYIHNLDKDRH